MNELIEVTVKHGDGAEGQGWYVWETEYPDEGYVGFFTTRPTEQELAEICPEYTEHV